MALDGVNLSALKLKDEPNSARLSIDSETKAMMAKDDLTLDVSKSKQIGRKEDNYGEDVENRSYSAGSTEGSSENSKDGASESEVTIIEYEKRYELSFSGDRQVVAIYDNEIDQQVAQLPTKNFVEIVSQLSNAKGLIHDKKA